MALHLWASNVHWTFYWCLWRQCGQEFKAWINVSWEGTMLHPAGVTSLKIYISWLLGPSTHDGWLCNASELLEYQCLQYRISFKRKYSFDPNLEMTLRKVTTIIPPYFMKIFYHLGGETISFKFGTFLRVPTRILDAFLITHSHK